MEDNKISKPISIDSLVLQNSLEHEIPAGEWKSVSELNIKYIDVLAEIAYCIYNNKIYFKVIIK